MKNIIFALFLTVFALGLQGCSAHPGAGHWLAVENTDSKFSKITVEFEGRAELIPTDSTAETQRCFWAGKSATAIQLQCTYGDDSGVELKYLLSVDSTGKEPVATLSLADEQLGVYHRQLQK